MINISEIQKDFPILNRSVNGKRLVYLDNSATTQKPRGVVEAMAQYYYQNNANIHRGIHTLSEEATEMYERARKKISKFFRARYPSEIIFTSGTTESVNLVASGWGDRNLSEGDEVVIFLSEHHSNFVPWQELCKRKNARMLVQNLNSEMEIDTKNLLEKINSRTRILVLSHASNVLGNIVDVKTIIHKARKINSQLRIFVDGAQYAPHAPLNLESLDADFYVVSGHKMLGPTGVGILFIKREIQDEVSPIKFGGGMIKEVYLDETTLKNSMEKFEGGTPNIAGVIGMESAISYLENIGLEFVREHSLELLDYFFDQTSRYDDLVFYGTSSIKNRVGLVSFNIKGIHPHDVSAVLASEGVAVRSGHHCAMPLHKHLEIPGSVRASFYIYNDYRDIDDLVLALDKARKILKD